MKVAIIGAGASGLASARRAIQYNLETVIFEENKHIGGIWMYNEDPISTSSPLYASLRTNLPVQLMEFTGFEFKAESGLCYPPHHDVLKYINDFTDHYDLRRFIQFQTRVVEIKRWKKEWVVSVKNMLDDSGPTEQYSFDAVMVCNGHNSIPFVPYIRGQETFSGQIIHSCIYRRNAPFEGQRLLVVGNGTSGKDIADECCKVANEVTVSCRRETEFTLDSSKFTVKPEIKFIQNDKVFFEDDTSINVDFILLCTGYLYEFPFIHESCGIKVHEGKVIEPLYKGFVNITQPSMCFIGVLQKAIIFPLVDLQAEVFVKHLVGRIQLPDRSTMTASLNEENKLKKEAGVPKSHYFYIGQNIQEYCMDLCHLGGIEPFAPVLFKVYYENAKRLKQFQRTYLKFEIIDDENFISYEER